MLQGIVTNVTAFGAFVDIGVHQDGLVHISHLADRFVKDPNEVVQVGRRCPGQGPLRRYGAQAYRPLHQRGGGGGRKEPEKGWSEGDRRRPR